MSEAMFRALLAMLAKLRTQWWRPPKARTQARRRDDPERRVDDELRYHLERRAEELIERGASPGEAERRAVEEFGDVGRARAYCARMAARVERRRRRRRAAGDLALDARYAARTLARTPAFTALTVLIMAVGIGANTAVFSVVNAVLLEPLDYPESDRLLQVWETDTRQSTFEDPISPVDLQDWREQAATLSEIAGYGYEALALAGDGPPERIVGIETSDNFFAVLGVEPALGRTFAADEEGPGHRVAVLGNALWRNRFAADPEVLGRSITLGGLPYVVIGVMPEGFAFPSAGELWVPFAFDVGQMSHGRSPRRGGRSYRDRRWHARDLHALAGPTPHEPGWRRPSTASDAPFSGIGAAGRWRRTPITRRAGAASPSPGSPHGGFARLLERSQPLGRHGSSQPQSTGPSKLHVPGSGNCVHGLRPA